MKWILKELLKLAESEVTFNIKQLKQNEYQIDLSLFGDKIISKTVTI